MTIEIITGDLRTAYHKTVPGTMLCVDQAYRERHTNPLLKERDVEIFTADGNVYSVEGIHKTPTWRITREVVQVDGGLVIINPLLKNIDDAFEQLARHKLYYVTPVDFEVVKSALDTVSIDITQLGLEGSDSIYRSLPIDTSQDIHAYNQEQQKLVRRIFGPTDEDYSTTMKALRTSAQKITQTKLFVLSPEYVLEKAASGPIALASKLGSVGGYSNSDFDAITCNIREYSRLLGERR